MRLVTEMSPNSAARAPERSPSATIAQVRVAVMIPQPPQETEEPPQRRDILPTRIKLRAHRIRARGLAVHVLERHPSPHRPPLVPVAVAIDHHEPFIDLRQIPIPCRGR